MEKQIFFVNLYAILSVTFALRLLENAEANAEYRGFDTEHLRIIHASAYPGRKIRKFIPRAFGRASPYFDTLCHVEVVLKQMEIE